jgi:D-alanyl-lipoteichoic acid acyltransferase DltB (MBOAT superfamily)
MFGFRFLENFDYPYISCSITEFWRRWHISLGTWFRDYVYISLGGNRVKSKARLLLNLFIVWLLTGIWHGANWTFVVWGLMYFVLLSIEKLLNIDKTNSFNIVRYIFTMLFVVLGWVVFRASNLNEAINYLKVMFGYNGTFIDNYALFFIKENIVYFFLGFVCSTPIIKRIYSKHLKENVFGSLFLFIGLLAISVLSITYVVREPTIRLYILIFNLEK